MFYINVLSLTIICVLVTDNTDFFDNVKKLLSSFLTSGKIKSSEYRLHLLDCSLCQSHWLGVITMFVMGCITIQNYLYILVLAISTPLINDIIILLFSIIETLIKKIKDIFQ